MIMSGIKATKTILRKEIHEVLTKLSTEQKKKQSEFIYNKLINLPEFKNSTRISIYLSTDDEVSTENIIRTIFKENKKCFVPRYNGNVMQMVKLNSMEDWDTLPLTKWNIKQPDLKEAREDALETGGLDLIITPGVAFTKNGGRLGHGKGYYDSFLHKLFSLQEKRPTVIGICFNEQLRENIPLSEHDVILDTILYGEN